MPRRYVEAGANIRASYPAQNLPQKMMPRLPRRFYRRAPRVVPGCATFLQGRAPGSFEATTTQAELTDRLEAPFSLWFDPLVRTGAHRFHEPVDTLGLVGSRPAPFLCFDPSLRRSPRRGAAGLRAGAQCTRCRGGRSGNWSISSAYPLKFLLQLFVHEHQSFDSATQITVTSGDDLIHILFVLVKKTVGVCV